MQISQVTIYGVQALRLLAKHSPLGAEQIAMRLDISISYAAKTMRALRIAGAVQASYGPQGGYTLAAPLEEIALGRLVDAAEGVLPDREGDTKDMASIRRSLRRLLAQALEEPVANL